MNKDYIFIVALLLFSAACLFSTFYIAKYFTQEKLKDVEKIPRNIPLGVIFGAAAIAWCVPQSLAVFSSNSVILFSIIALIAYLIGCFFLDYLFARALAGFIILLSHYFMAQSFAAVIPLLWLFSIFVLIMGTAAIVIGGIPHYMRDFIRSICRNKAFKFSMMALLSLYTLIGLYAALIQFA
jgi:hypothetical protein